MLALSAPARTSRNHHREAPRVRLVALVALMVALTNLGACSLPANEGMVRMHDHPQPFAQAHAMCWEKSMGSNYAGGNGQFGSEMNLYDSCMAQTGWTHSKSMFSVASPN